MSLLTVSLSLLLIAYILLALAVLFGIVKDNPKAFDGFALACLIAVVAALAVAFVALLLGQYQIPEVK